MRMKPTQRGRRNSCWQRHDGSILTASMPAAPAQALRSLPWVKTSAAAAAAVAEDAIAEGTPHGCGALHTALQAAHMLAWEHERAHGAPAALLPILTPLMWGGRMHGMELCIPCIITPHACSPPGAELDTPHRVQRVCWTRRVLCEGRAALLVTCCLGCWLSRSRWLCEGLLAGVCALAGRRFCKAQVPRAGQPQPAAHHPTELSGCQAAVRQRCSCGLMHPVLHLHDCILGSTAAIACFSLPSSVTQPAEAARLGDTLARHTRTAHHMHEAYGSRREPSLLSEGFFLPTSVLSCL